MGLRDKLKSIFKKSKKEPPVNEIPLIKSEPEESIAPLIELSDEEKEYETAKQLYLKYQCKRHLYSDEEFNTVQKDFREKEAKLKESGILK